MAPTAFVVASALFVLAIRADKNLRRLSQLTLNIVHLSSSQPPKVHVRKCVYLCARECLPACLCVCLQGHWLQAA